MDKIKIFTDKGIIIMNDVEKIDMNKDEIFVNSEVGTFVLSTYELNIPVSVSLGQCLVKVNNKTEKEMYVRELNKKE